MSDPLDSMTVTVVSPDGNLAAEVDSGFGLTLRFRVGSYQQYDARSLAHQLEQLGRLAWVAYQRERRKIVERSGRVINDWDPNRREYRQALTRIEATGTSDAGWVTVRTTGLAHWRCDIRPGTLTTLTQPGLVAELQSALTTLIGRYQQQVVLLKDRYFRFDLPPELRQRYDEALYR